MAKLEFDYVKYACNVLNAWKIEYEKDDVTEFTGHVIDELIKSISKPIMVDYMHMKYHDCKSQDECNDQINHEVGCLRTKIFTHGYDEVIINALGNSYKHFVTISKRLIKAKARNAELLEMKSKIVDIVCPEINDMPMIRP